MAKGTSLQPKGTWLPCCLWLADPQNGSQFGSPGNWVIEDHVPKSLVKGGPSGRPTLYISCLLCAPGFGQGSMRGTGWLKFQTADSTNCRMARCGVKRWIHKTMIVRCESYLAGCFFLRGLQPNQSMGTAHAVQAPCKVPLDPLWGRHPNSVFGCAEMLRFMLALQSPSKRRLPPPRANNPIWLRLKIWGDAEKPSFWFSCSLNNCKKRYRQQQASK